MPTGARLGARASGLLRFQPLSSCPALSPPPAPGQPGPGCVVCLRKWLSVLTQERNCSWGLCILFPLDFSSTACLVDFSMALGPLSLPLGVLSFLPPNPFLLPSFLPSLLGSWVPTWRSGQSDGETGSGQGFVLGHRSDCGAVDTAGGQPTGAGGGHSC